MGRFVIGMGDLQVGNNCQIGADLRVAVGGDADGGRNL